MWQAPYPLKPIAKIQDESVRVKLVLIITVAILFSGCVAAPTPTQKTQAVEADLAKVRVVPESQVNSCEFITQTNITQGQSFFGGQAALPNDAEKRMKQEARSLGADTMVVTDRMYDDGGGSGKRPKLSLFADLYKCKSVSVSSSTKSDPVSDSAKSKSVPVSKSVLFQVQSKLKEMGYYSGTIDGLYGPQTAGAIGAFQKDSNLPFTGNADSATLDELRIAR